MDRSQRAGLVRFGGWYFLAIGLLLSLIGLRYLSDYPWPSEMIARIYTVLAFVSHFGSLAILPWILVVLPVTLIAPSRRLVVALCVGLGAAILAIALVDSLVFAEDRFHLSALALSILGWHTWGFAALYFAIFLGLCSLIARSFWRRFSESSGRALASSLAALVLAPFLATQALHIWADASFYTPISSFTPYLPLFRPWTARDPLVAMGIVDAGRAPDRSLLERLSADRQGLLRYPLAELQSPASIRPASRRIRSSATAFGWNCQWR